MTGTEVAGVRLKLTSSWYQQLLSVHFLEAVAEHAVSTDAMGNVGRNSFGQLAMETNRQSDGCLLSSIIVRASTGTPGAGLDGYARSQGFDAPFGELQQQVFDHFHNERTT